jgi:hypothetical protein
MNQDDVKAALEKLRPTEHSFTLVFSGKKSSRVNGLYKPATQEIVIHNRNFETDNDLLFTALHEYAHHIDCTESLGKVSSRAHTLRFWSTFHALLGLAEASGLYRNPAKTEAFSETTASLKNLIGESGRIMREIGRLLIEAQSLCTAQGARFDDYVMRTLKLTMPWAQAAMRAAALELDPSLGAENMKSIAAIKDDDARAAAAAALSGDASPQQVKTQRAFAKEPEDVLERLEKEKTRIARTVNSLLKREEELDRQIADLRSSA